MNGKPALSETLVQKILTLGWCLPTLGWWLPTLGWWNATLARVGSHPRPKLLLGSWGFGPFLAALAVRCAQGASASTSSEEFRPRVGLPPQARVGFHQPRVGSHQPRVGIHQPRVMIFRTSVSYRAGLLHSFFVALSKWWKNLSKPHCLDPNGFVMLLQQHFINNV